MLRSLFLKSDEFTKADITRSENEAALTAATQSEWVEALVRDIHSTCNI